jgi:hypothetical protein
MTVSKKANTKKSFKIKLIWAIGLIIIGFLFLFFRIGQDNFLVFPSAGLFLIYVGFIALIVAIIPQILNKNRIVDERAEHIGYKASRITTILLFLTLFITIIIDEMITIKIPYSIYASFLTCFYVICYLLSYKLIEMKN